jgi:formylglycine-generating enzyme required for sulfatase activity
MKKKSLVIQVLFILVSVFTFKHASANNIQVSTPSFKNFNSSLQEVNIVCNVTWDNSWRNNINYDAAWLFVKYRVDKGEWKHARLSSTVANYTVPNNASLITVPDGGGVFIQRALDASNSTFTVSNLELSWPYGAQGVLDNANLEVKVFALEMVHVPAGSFYLGNGTVQSGSSFYQSGLSNTPYLVNSESLIVVDNVAPNATIQSALGITHGLWANGFSGNVTTDNYDTIPSAFPKGFNAFYCMKYELTQSGYVDFLNTLNYTQQANHTISSPSAARGTAALILNNGNRNGIDIMTPGINSSRPAVYGCNLDGDTIFNENNDGAFIACGGLSWTDLGAYLDWAALRPMTEFEFEKASRGPNYPVNYEYAWGDSTISQVIFSSNGGLDNSGTPSEGIKNINYGSSGNGALLTTMSGMGSPLRVGIFASHENNANNRRQSGATYYGIMEMSGNIIERCVTIFNKPIGRKYEGTHGDGNLSVDGYADAPTWPLNDALGIGFRGGSYNFSNSVHRTSARNYINPPIATREIYSGGRGVRTNP